MLKYDTGIDNKKFTPTYVQALTTPRKIRLPIGQPVGKNQVAPTAIQVAPFGRELF